MFGGGVLLFVCLFCFKIINEENDERTVNPKGVARLKCCLPFTFWVFVFCLFVFDFFLMLS